MLSLFIAVNILKATELQQWEEIASSKDGIQFVDRSSIKINEEDNIELLSMFKSSNISNDNKSEIFLMEVNCSTFSYKDNSINGVITSNPKWQRSYGDSLIEEVIRLSCSNEYN